MRMWELGQMCSGLVIDVQYLIRSCDAGFRNLHLNARFHCVHDIWSSFKSLFIPFEWHWYVHRFISHGGLTDNEKHCFHPSSYVFTLFPPSTKLTEPWNGLWNVLQTAIHVKQTVSQLQNTSPLSSKEYKYFVIFYTFCIFFVLDGFNISMNAFGKTNKCNQKQHQISLLYPRQLYL